MDTEMFKAVLFIAGSIFFIAVGFACGYAVGLAKGATYGYREGAKDAGAKCFDGN